VPSVHLAPHWFGPHLAETFSEEPSHPQFWVAWVVSPGVASSLLGICPSQKFIDPEAPPLRPERHVSNSIATLRRRLIVKLVASLSRCPCCAVKTQGRALRNL
jgi:hypothetical protein